MDSSFFKGFMLGSLVGVIIALFMAPQPGEDTVAQLKEMSLTYKDLLEEGALVGAQALKQGKDNIGTRLNNTQASKNGHG